jgi:hypothetical protein
MRGISRLADGLLVALKGSAVCSWSDDFSRSDKRGLYRWRLEMCDRSGGSYRVPFRQCAVCLKYRTIQRHSYIGRIVCLSDSVRFAENVGQFKGTATCCLFHASQSTEWQTFIRGCLPNVDYTCHYFMIFPSLVCHFTAKSFQNTSA